MNRGFSRGRADSRLTTHDRPLTIDHRLSTALADRYRIEREVGQGGMATVYLADRPAATIGRSRSRYCALSLPH